MTAEQALQHYERNKCFYLCNQGQRELYEMIKGLVEKLKLADEIIINGTDDYWAEINADKIKKWKTP